MPNSKWFRPSYEFFSVHPRIGHDAAIVSASKLFHNSAKRPRVSLVAKQQEFMTVI
jgi:hypothetical protein